MNNNKISNPKTEVPTGKNLNDKDYIITLEIEGKELTSEEFAQKIDKNIVLGE